MDIFMNISKYIKNQRLKIELLVVLDLLNMMNGSDRDCGAYKVDFQSQNKSRYITTELTAHATFTVHARFHVQFTVHAKLRDRGCQKREVGS